MVGNRTVAIWVLIQLVPLSILYFVYTFFSDQNFFQLEGAWKGVVASGPIAAYIFITWIGFKYLKELISISFRFNEGTENVIGEWNFTSSSEGHVTASGCCEIAVRDNKLRLSGNYNEKDEMTTLWQSDVAFLDGNNLFYVYKLESHDIGYIGYVRLRIMEKKNKKATKMSGEWVAVGEEKKRGNTTITRNL